MIAAAASPSNGALAVGAAGAVVALAGLIDLFVTLFNYDGFSFLANRLHGLVWRLMRVLTRPLPTRARHAALSLGSASMLPFTYGLWLGLEIVGFAMMFLPGLEAGDFSLTHTARSIGAAFYLSAGDISSLTFGDVVARSGLMRALVDLETIVGLTTFTLALGYVVTTFGVLRTLDGLHAIVRRHAEDPTKPSSILARHFRGGSASELPSLLESITDKLEDYDQGLRRYPVVYYFHTRRVQRSIPRIFAQLGRLIELLRWGLPADEQIAQDPLLAAMLDEYDTTIERLQRTFVGPSELDPPQPVSEQRFINDADTNQDGQVAAFHELQARARTAAGIEPPGSGDRREAYQQYREWLPFQHRNRIVLARIADALGYERE